MEFKQSNRYNRRRPGQDISPRSAPAPTITQPSRRPAPPQTSRTAPLSSDVQDDSAAPTRRKLFTKRTVIIAGVVIIAAGGIVAAKMIHQPEARPVVSAPTYPTVLPNKKSVNELGGWTRVSPPEQDPVFAYSDTVGGVPISISQQPLPQTFENNTDDQIAELARKFNATTKLEAGNTTVYLGTSAKGPQSVILTKKNLLIMIKSEKKITDAAWIKYVKSLD